VVTQQEVKRLAQVYRNYRENPVVRAQWDESNPGNRAILRERQRAIRKTLGTHGFLPLASRRVLDVGCGTGKVLAGLVELGAQPNNLHGIDLLPDRIGEARKSYPSLHFQYTNAERLEFRNDSFDLVVLFTVLSSILDDQMAQNVAHEAARVLRPGGAVLWYDFRYDNPRNPNVRGIRKRHMEALFPDFQIHLHTITLFPFLARHLGRLAPLLYPILAAISPLRTHYLGLLMKSGVRRKER